MESQRRYKDEGYGSNRQTSVVAAVTSTSAGTAIEKEVEGTFSTLEIRSHEYNKEERGAILELQRKGHLLDLLGLAKFKKGNRSESFLSLGLVVFQIDLGHLVVKLLETQHYAIGLISNWDQIEGMDDGALYSDMEGKEVISLAISYLLGIQVNREGISVP